MPAANLVEVFSSIQGEGPYLGTRALFVRFGECDLRCRWCDSPHTWRPAADCRVETAAGSGSFRSLPNPVALPDVLAAADALDAPGHRFVSLTGGEPLLQPEAVGALARALRARGARVFLETGGHRPEALARVVEALDVVSMDWKLASDVRRREDPRHGPVEAFHDVHEAFLRVARRAPAVVVKLVLTAATLDSELEEAWQRIAGVDPGVPVVLQPVTPRPGAAEPMPSARVLALARRAARCLADVRVIPQTHPLLGVP